MDLLVITTGGKLAALAKKHGMPIWGFEHQGQPRAAVGLSFMFILAALMKLGLVSDKSADVAEAVAEIDRPLVRFRHRRLAHQCPAGIARPRDRSKAGRKPTPAAAAASASPKRPVLSAMRRL